MNDIVKNGIDDSNCSTIKNRIPEIRQKFVSMCQIIHDKNPQEYHFLEEKQKYCGFDCQVNKNLCSLLSNNENKVLTNDESVLYKALLYVNCCRKLLINLNMVPDCFKNNINLCNAYYNLLLKQFREDLAPVF